MVHSLNKAGVEVEMWDVPMGPVYSAVNALQSVAWRVNVPVLETVEQLWKAGSGLAGIPSSWDYARLDLDPVRASVDAATGAILKASGQAPQAPAQADADQAGEPTDR